MLHIQKFDSIRISLLCDITKIWKKSTILKMLKTYVLHNNNSKKVSKICQKNNCFINNQMTYCFLFQINLLIFQNPYEFLNFFSKFWNINETLRIWDVFVTRFYTTNKNFSGNWTNSCTVIASKCFFFFFKNGIFINVKKNWTNLYGFWKIDEFI